MTLFDDVSLQGMIDKFDNTATPNPGESMVYNNGKWGPELIEGGGGGSTYTSHDVASTSTLIIPDGITEIRVTGIAGGGAGAGAANQSGSDAYGKGGGGGGELCDMLTLTATPGTLFVSIPAGGTANTSFDFMNPGNPGGNLVLSGAASLTLAGGEGGGPDSVAGQNNMPLTAVGGAGGGTTGADGGNGYAGTVNGDAGGNTSYHIGTSVASSSGGAGGAGNTVGGGGGGGGAGLNLTGSGGNGGDGGGGLVSAPGNSSPYGAGGGGGGCTNATSAWGENGQPGFIRIEWGY